MSTTYDGNDLPFSVRTNTQQFWQAREKELLMDPQERVSEKGLELLREKVQLHNVGYGTGKVPPHREDGEDRWYMYGLMLQHLETWEARLIAGVTLQEVQERYGEKKLQKPDTKSSPTTLGSILHEGIKRYGLDGLLRQLNG